MLALYNMFRKKEDLYAPRMPEVNEHADFADAVRLARLGASADRPLMGEIEAGRCRLAIIAPERTVRVLAGPEPGSAPPQFVATAKRLLPSTAPMNITGVGFTGVRKLMNEDLPNLPFVTALLSFAYIGHNVLARREPLEIRLDPDQPLPDLADLATDPEEIDWTSKLPFQYDTLSVEEIIRIVADTPRVTWSARPDGRTATRVKMLLAGPGGKAAPVMFDFELAGDGTARRLLIRRWEPPPAPRESES